MPEDRRADRPRRHRFHDLLRDVDSSPVVRLNRAVVVGHADGPAAAPAEVDTQPRPAPRRPRRFATSAATKGAAGADRQAPRHTADPAEGFLPTARPRAGDTGAGPEGAGRPRHRSVAAHGRRPLAARDAQRE